MLLFLLACPKPVGPPEVHGLPLIPAPDAPIYSAAPGEPADPLVAWVVPEGALYDETLAGAAVGLAEVISTLGGHDEAALRWACIRAGWPYEVGRVVTVRTANDQVPSQIQVELANETAPFGLARYRDGAGDLWVLITGSIAVMLPPIDREPEVGDEVSVRPQASGWTDWQQRVLPPNEQVRSGPAVYGEPGEWLLELSAMPLGGPGATAERQVVARLPIYVGQETPHDGPFLGIDMDKPAASAVPELALTYLNVLRDVMRVRDLEGDLLLDSAARNGLAGPMDEPWAKAGYSSGAQVECTGQTVRGCLDHLFWDIDSRTALRDPSFGAVGVAAEWTPQGLHLVIELAG